MIDKRQQDTLRINNTKRHDTTRQGKNYATQHNMVQHDATRRDRTKLYATPLERSTQHDATRQIDTTQQCKLRIAPYMRAAVSFSDPYRPASLSFNQSSSPHLRHIFIYPPPFNFIVFFVSLSSYFISSPPHSVALVGMVGGAAHSPPRTCCARLRHVFITYPSCFQLSAPAAPVIRIWGSMRRI